MDLLNIQTDLAIDIQLEAAAIEYDLGPFLKKVEGLYLPGREEPTIKPLTNYYRMVQVPNEALGAPPTLQPMPYNQGELFDGTIFNADGDIVVSKTLVSRLRPQPYVPVYGFRIIEAILSHVLDTCQPWKGLQAADLPARLEKYFRTDIDWESAGVKDGKPIKLTQLINRVMDDTTKLRKDLHDFMHQDKDTEWCVHVLKRRGRFITVARHQDFRLSEYLRLQAEGQLDFLNSSEGIEAFQQWQQKKEQELAKAVGRKSDAVVHRLFLESPFGKRAYTDWQNAVEKNVIPPDDLPKLLESKLKFLNSPVGGTAFRHWLSGAMKVTN